MTAIHCTRRQARPVDRTSSGTRAMLVRLAQIEAARQDERNRRSYTAEVRAARMEREREMARDERAMRAEVRAAWVRTRIRWVSLRLSSPRGRRVLAFVAVVILLLPVAVTA